MLKTRATLLCFLIFILTLTAASIFAKSDNKQTETTSAQKSDQSAAVSTPTRDDDNEKVTEHSPSPKSRREQQFAKLTQSQDDPNATIKPAPALYIGGLGNVDLVHQTYPELTNNKATAIAISALQLNAEMIPTDWLQAHMGLFYASDLDYYYLPSPNKRKPEINTAYLTFANFNTCPLYVRIGKQYLPFGRYKRYPIIKPLTESLAETRQNAFEAGFISLKGLYGAIYAFNGIDGIHQNKNHSFNNFGATINYKAFTGPMGFDIGADYLYNMADAGIINYALPRNHFHSRIDGLALHLNVFSGPFDYQIQYVKALKHFDEKDISYSPRPGKICGAKPSAGTVKAGYYFKTAGKDSKITLGYSWSKEAKNLPTDTLQYFPKNRISASYGINLVKRIILIFKLARDRDYLRKQGGTNETNYIGAVRVTVLLK